MNLGWIITALVALWIFSRSGGSFANLFPPGGAFGPSGVPPVLPTQAVAISPVAFNATQTAAITQQSIGAGTQAATSALTALNVGSGVLKAIPVIGAIFGAVAATLLAASEMRRKQAINENSAVAAAIPGWDQAIAKWVYYYNAGQITAAQAKAGFAQAMANYWNETSGQIQPGRNGCDSGQSWGMNFNPCAGSKDNTGRPLCCAGDWGAACCVAGADLMPGIGFLSHAIDQTERSGAPVTVMMPKVFPSKYGGTDRESYPVTVKRP